MGEQRGGRVDWHRVLDDIAYLGLTGDALAARIGLRVGLLQRVASGKLRPAPMVAGRIAGLWGELTGKPERFLPRTAEPEGAPRPEVAGIESNEPREQSYAELQAIVMVWGQITRRLS